MSIAVLFHLTKSMSDWQVQSMMSSGYSERYYRALNAAVSEDFNTSLE